MSGSTKFLVDLRSWGCFNRCDLFRSPSRERIFTFHKCWTIPQSSHRQKWPMTLISRTTTKFVNGKDIGKFIRFKLNDGSESWNRNIFLNSQEHKPHQQLYTWFPLGDHFNLKGLFLLSNPRGKVNIMY